MTTITTPSLEQTLSSTIEAYRSPADPNKSLFSLESLLGTVNTIYPTDLQQFRKEKGLFSCARLVADIFTNTFPNEELPSCRSIVLCGSTEESYHPDTIQSAITNLDLYLAINREIKNPSSSLKIIQVLSQNNPERSERNPTTFEAFVLYLKDLSENTKKQIQADPIFAIGHGIKAVAFGVKQGWTCTWKDPLDVFGDWWLLMSKTTIKKTTPEFAMWKRLTQLLVLDENKKLR